MGSCKHDNEILSSVKDKEYLAQLSDSQLLKKGSAT
jgi:hypothetical protein